MAEENETKEVKEETKTQAKADSQYEKLIGEIEKLSVKDLAALVKDLEERWGVSAAAPVAVAAAAGAAGGEVAAAEEKSEYTVVLKDGGAQKIAVIKAVRQFRPDLGLKEAKDLVDGAPKTVKENMPKDEAEEAKKALEAAGATVELQ